MIILYTTLILLAFWAEISIKCDTHNIIKKFGLLLVILGCFGHLAHKDNCLIEIGVLCYISMDMLKAYLVKSNRRKSDRITT